MKRINIVLVGFMGTGKSAAGRRVAERLTYRFVDMDAIIEERTGRSIPEIFAERGEPHFRGLERELVRELAAQEGLVISAGGGIVLDGENIKDFSRNSVVICLSASVEAILQRVGGDRNRPLLAGGDKEKKVHDLLLKRKPLYDAIPYQIDTTRLNPEQVADRVLEIYRGAGSA